MIDTFRTASWMLGCAMALGCSSAEDDRGSGAPGPEGGTPDGGQAGGGGGPATGRGGAGAGGAAAAGQGGGGTGGDGAGGTSVDGGPGAAGAGGGASTDAASSSGGGPGADGGSPGDAGADGGSECAAGARRCNAEQPQICAAGSWVDDGDPCSIVEPCDAAGATCTVASLEVPGGTFYRSYDVDPSTYTDQSSPATVSTVRLDKYEVTVGQYRRFGTAVVAGWRPAEGAGKHVHLNGGSGVANSGPGGGHEGGWDSAWDAELPATETDWNTEHTSCTLSMWTAEPGANELRPINCVTWYDAYAYCIWSGGFLPTEAEWNFAAAGGTEQRMYAWGSTAPTASLAVFNTSAPAAVGSKPAGDGRWGHSDLAGNLYEWVLDWQIDPYDTPCTDCARLEVGDLANRAKRGGNYATIGHGSLRTGHRSYTLPGWRVAGNGIRCARAPE